MRNLLRCSLITLLGVSIYDSSVVGATVVWTIDASESYIRLNIPDQLIPINGLPQEVGVRDYSGPFFSPGAVAWTDAGGKKSAVQGTISSDYQEGVSISFTAGAHTASAVPFGSFRPDGATWNGTTYDPNSSAPAAFGASLVILPSSLSFVGGFAAIRNVSYDLQGPVSLNSSGGNWVGTNHFQAGVVPGALAHVLSVAGDFNETLDETVISENAGSFLSIENLPAGLRRLRLPLNIPVVITIDANTSLQANAVGEIVATATVVQPAEVVAQFVYHGGYSGSGTPPDNRIDTGKIVAKEGTGPTVLGYNNVINTSRGINGIAFDIQNLGNAASLSSADFEVQVSPTGAFDAVANPPSGWAAGPAPLPPTVTPGSPSRVLLEWANNSITNRWLRLTIKANTNTGLSSPQTYYIGHLLGETSGLSGTVYTVAFADISPIRADAGQTVNANSITDIDKTGTVSFADISAMRPNVGAQLSNITIP